MPWLQRTGRLLLFAFLSVACADYHIDDTNTTLTYSSGPKAAWAPYAVGAETLELLLPNSTYQVINASVCWNQTYRYAACFDTDNCLLTVPFTGSGITVYVYQAGPVGINASITVDGAYAQTNVLNAPPAPAYEVANVSMFNVQQLPSGSHSLSLLINDLFGSYSGMMFDYAYINESFVANATATTSATASTTATSTSTSASASASSSSHTNTAAIVGGVIAAVVLIVAGILAYLWIRHRRKGRTPEMSVAYDPSVGHNPTMDNSMTRGLAPARSTEFSTLTPLVPNRLGSTEVQYTPLTPSPPRAGRDILTPFTATSSTSNSSGARSKSRAVLSDDTASTNVTPPSPPGPQIGHASLDSRQDTSPLLTDEQADFINSLHQNNVPAAAIARVVERMLADRHAGIREWERETRLARSNTMTTAPPSYDLVAEGG